MRGLGPSRDDLRRLSEAKLTDATLPFAHERWGNSYYLAGYAVELGLKAFAVKYIRAETIPDRKFVNDLLVHDLERLVGIAGLRAPLRIEQDFDQRFSTWWAIVCEWRPDCRYESTDKTTAHYMISALQDSDHGVMRWIKQHW